jgi:hypothetical protein
MAKGVRVKLHDKGMRELLKSAEVRAHLTDRMQRVLSTAQAGAGEGIDYQLVQGTTDRARVSVGSDSPGALFEEAHRGNLARALDSAG